MEYHAHQLQNDPIIFEWCNFNKTSLCEGEPVIDLNHLKQWHHQTALLLNFAVVHRLANWACTCRVDIQRWFYCASLTKIRYSLSIFLSGFPFGSFKYRSVSSVWLISALLLIYMSRTLLRWYNIEGVQTVLWSFSLCLPDTVISCHNNN